MSVSLIISILATSTLFNIFKFFEKYRVVSLNAIVINYMVASALAFLLPDKIKPFNYVIHQPWFPISILLGFLFVVLFQIMAYSSQKIDVSTTTIANKITFVFPTIMGILFFSEDWNYLKITGFIVAITSIILSAENKRQFPKTKTYLVILLLFFGGGILESLLSYCQKFLIQPFDTSIFFGYLFLFAFLFGLIILIWNINKGKETPSRKDVFWGLVLGVPNYFSMYFLLESLNDLPSSTVFPVANMGVILCSTFISVLLFRERISRKKSIALLCSILAILLISYNDFFS